MTEEDVKCLSAHLYKSFQLTLLTLKFAKLEPDASAIATPLSYYPVSSASDP